MKIHQYNQMMKQLTDPGPSKSSIIEKRLMNNLMQQRELINQVEKNFQKIRLQQTTTECIRYSCNEY